MRFHHKRIQPIKTVPFRFNFRYVRIERRWGSSLRMLELITSQHHLVLATGPVGPQPERTPKPEEPQKRWSEHLRDGTGPFASTG